MKKREFWLLVVFVVAIGSVAYYFYHPHLNSSSIQTQQENVDIHLQENDEKVKTRIIVTFNMLYKPEGQLNTDEVTAQRLAIKQLQEKFKSEYGSSIEVISEYKSIPSMAIQVDTQLIKNIQENPLVKAVEQDLTLDSN